MVAVMLLVVIAAVIAATATATVIVIVVLVVAVIVAAVVKTVCVSLNKKRLFWFRFLFDSEVNVCLFSGELITFMPLPRLF